MNYNATLRAAIETAISTPADPKVSGSILQQKLIAMMNAVDTGAVYLGEATPSTTPTTEANCFFVATQAGTYTHFLTTGGTAIVVAEGEAALIRSTIYQDMLRWVKTTLLTGSSAQLAVPTTWAALKALRDGGQLVPGTWYRITDYQCTTTTAGTYAAIYPFDIIVRADNASHLNENAYAAHNANDDHYFDNCKLEAWQLRYCIDNDTSRFDWADTVNGKGVVYFMRDEHGNQCPYDFKNIMFTRPLTNGEFDDVNGDDTSVFTFCIFFDSIGINADGSITKNGLVCHDNVIGELRSEEGILMLNNIVFLNRMNLFDPSTNSLDCHGNTFGKYCANNTFGKDCANNTFGKYCANNTFGENFYGNTIENGLENSVFAADFEFNTVFGGVAASFVGSVSGTGIVSHCQIMGGNYVSSILFVSEMLRPQVAFIGDENGTVVVKYLSESYSGQ